ncbi:hypothetical protein FJT64_002111 [Amphibalanus amphitrite]|uniref:Uncharacterized protein n=1 Tax=Amphibalanus amphitrite TaxID=1232801 RepID=A0A6A4WN14_AMPAM|nr:hypothetical protein FJT64_002111 [Amphibalanus amphitrite]
MEVAYPDCHGGVVHLGCHVGCPRGPPCKLPTRAAMEAATRTAVEAAHLGCHRGPEVTDPSWPGWDEDGVLSVSLLGVAADTISHLADLGRTVTGLEIYGEQRQHGQAADKRAQRMAITE